MNYNDPQDDEVCECGEHDCVCEPVHRCRNPLTCSVCEDNGYGDYLYEAWRDE